MTERTTEATLLQPDSTVVATENLEEVDHEVETQTRDIALQEHAPGDNAEHFVAFLDEEPSSSPDEDKNESRNAGLWARANSNLTEGTGHISNKKFADARQELEQARTQYEAIFESLPAGALPDSRLGKLLAQDIHTLYQSLAGTYSELAAQATKDKKPEDAQGYYVKAAEALLAYRDLCKRHNIDYNTEAFKKASRGDTVELEAADNFYNAGKFDRAVALYQEAFLDRNLTAEQRGRIIPYMQGCYERGKLDIDAAIKKAEEPLKAQLHLLQVQILNNSSNFDGAIKAADAFIKTYGESKDATVVAQRQQVTYLAARACYWKAAALVRSEQKDKWSDAAKVYEKAVGYLQSDDYSALVKARGNQKCDINITYSELLHVSRALYGVSLVFSNGNSETAHSMLSQALQHGGALTQPYAQHRDQAAIAYAHHLSQQATPNWQRIYDLAHPVAYNSNYLGQQFQRQAAGLLEAAEEKGGIKGVSK